MRGIGAVLRWVVLVGLVACGSGGGDRHFDHEEFSFDYPSRWQLMGELWPQNRPEANYKNLGVDEIVTVTSVRKQGDLGLWATVASTTLDGGGLQAYVDRTYAETVPEIEDIAEATVAVGELTGIELVYRRPWGDPWWAFRDIWLARDGNIYLVSFHALSLDDYQEGMDLVIGSFELH